MNCKLLLRSGNTKANAPRLSCRVWSAHCSLRQNVSLQGGFLLDDVLVSCRKRTRKTQFYLTSLFSMISTGGQHSFLTGMEQQNFCHQTGTYRSSCSCSQMRLPLWVLAPVLMAHGSMYHGHPIDILAYLPCIEWFEMNPIYLVCVVWRKDSLASGLYLTAIICPFAEHGKNLGQKMHQC